MRLAQERHRGRRADQRRKILHEPGEAIERLLLEAAERAGTELPGVLTRPPPTVRLIPGFGERGIVFTLTVWVRDVVEQDAAQDVIRSHILELARAAPVEIRSG